MAGRKPKPTAVKKLEGNPGKRKLNSKKPVHAKGMTNADCPFLVKVSIDDLNIRKGAGWISLDYCQRA